jgi:hypothetical protein
VNKCYLTILAFATNCALGATYQQPLQCQATGIALNSPSTSATVTCPNVPPPPTGCTNPPVILSSTPGIANYSRLTGIVQVNYFGGGYKEADATSFDSIYTTWPGNPTLTAAIAVPTNRYLSEQFVVPAGFMEKQPVMYSNYTINASGFNAGISMSISTSCGDFSAPNQVGSTVVPGCWTNKHGPYTPGPLQWRNNLTCILKDGTTYFLNIINADVGSLHPGNTGTAASTSPGKCSGACTDPCRRGSGELVI